MCTGSPIKRDSFEKLIEFLTDSYRVRHLPGYLFFVRDLHVT